MPLRSFETQSAGSGRKRRGSLGQEHDTATTATTAAEDINAKVTPHRLCAVCTATISKSHLLNDRIGEIKMTFDSWGCTERREQFAHQPSLEALKSSARDGCHLCSLLCPIAPERSLDQVIDDEQKGADNDNDNDNDVPDPMEGYGPHPLSALNVTPQVRQERQRRRQRRTEQLDRIKDGPSVDIAGVALQFTWGCREWEERIEAKSGSFVSINLELDWHLSYPMERNGRKALFVYRTEYLRSGGEKWEANREDPIDVVHDAQISVSTGSDASFNLAKHWLAKCKREHAVCRKAVRSASRFPTRLLDLGSGKKDQTIRLRVGLGRKEFVSLSHRWGDSQPLRLLQSNFEAFKKEIRPEDLPKTFRDAVAITRELGYQYLWIDSLCIIQDSKEDWMTESAIMGQIYRCSALNISAGGAQDSSSGCFVTREPLQHRACILTGDATAGFCVPRRCPNEWSSSDGSSTISRGWVFQERMLAPRTLHYSRKTISWECICLDATEGRPEGDTWNWEQDRRYRRPKEIFQTLCDFQRPAEENPTTFPLANNKDVETFYSAWSELLKDYSHKKLTQGSDKLVALHGVMSIVAESTGLRQAVGMWLDYLHLDLIWSTWSPASKRPEFYDPTKYRAPSWSWACVDSGVRLDCHDLHGGRYENILGLSMWTSYTLTAQFRVAEVVVSAQPNGQASYGHLAIEGRIRKMEWSENSGVEGFKHNRQARSVSDQWSPDFLRATSLENWGLLLLEGTGTDTKDVRVDVIMALDRVEAEGGKRWVFRRAGLVQQYYWKRDTYPVFRDGREEVNERIYLI
ncbi:heterokaryon incompatibility protein-domain-containing protein [Dichotomopilus funicola]|uniref:Heterokaryon incompatibility protein-domain-containing protein n=1 Tax=Dichotomopilus funicola TaxID=1934379 RepID=A0AAN6UWH5_9PEZI|nr:heterokaryon incompatibility protein-domain-containing protein [Dichotomopilus funicola]